jgi:hypothetical protein
MVAPAMAAKPHEAEFSELCALQASPSAASNATGVVRFMP